MSTVFMMRNNNHRGGRMVKQLELCTDSDWASDQVTRKSTSGAMIMAEGMRLHAHSRGQASVAVAKQRYWQRQKASRRHCCCKRC